MTKLLKQAMTEAKKLPDTAQDAMAALILEAIKDGILWDKAFGKSQGTLAKLAAEAMAEDRAGKTKELNPERL